MKLSRSLAWARPSGLLGGAVSITVIAVLALLSTAEAGTAGYIDTFAGGGVGDGERALEAPLHGPAGIAFDSDGALFIGQYCRIRKIAGGYHDSGRHGLLRRWR